jgi:UMF1 family MFS transporter
MIDTPSRRALVGWALFDCAVHPFFVLVSTFVFAPYFAAVLAPDPVAGQALWGYATAGAGLVLALLSPVLGSVADATGAKKPYLAACSLVLALACVTLWWAAPGWSGAVPLALAAFAIGTVAAEVAAVFNNAIMVRLVAPAAMGRLSGIGWATGYAGGLVSLLLVLGFLAPDPGTGRTYLGLVPLFGLDPAHHEAARVTGPLSALWLVLFLWPLFLFTPDAPRSGVRLGPAVRSSLDRLAATARAAWRHPVIGRFLIANMVYQDGLVALFVFGGIYGAGLFGWGTAALGLFGIVLTIAGVVGAVCGGVLDDRFGSRRVILGALAGLILVCVGLLSLGRDHVLFVVPVAPAPSGAPPFGSLPEQVFLGLGIVIGLVAGPLQASSRTYLARLAPPAETGRYFGLLALSGKVTSFLAPLTVAFATESSGTQAAGPAVLIAFYGIGALLLVGTRQIAFSAGSGGGP